jgi:hypothetical protein
MNGATATRSAVAANPAAGAKTNLALTNDREECVRASLAEKIGRLLPGLLFSSEAEHLRELTLATLNALSLDKATAVRATLVRGHQASRQRAQTDRAAARARRRNNRRPAHPRIFAAAGRSGYFGNPGRRARHGRVLRRCAPQGSFGGRFRCDRGELSTRKRSPLSSAMNRPKSAKRRSTRSSCAQPKWPNCIIPLVLRADLSAGLIRKLARFVGTALIEMLAMPRRAR